MTLIKSTKHNQKTYAKREDRDRAWLVDFYDIRPGNGASLFFQPRSPHRATEEKAKQNGKSTVLDIAPLNGVQ